MTAAGAKRTPASDRRHFMFSRRRQQIVTRNAAQRNFHAFFVAADILDLKKASKSDPSIAWWINCLARRSASGPAPTNSRASRKCKKAFID
jgi:hypothetical protein